MALSGSFEKSLVSGHYVIRVERSAKQSVVKNTLYGEFAVFNGCSCRLIILPKFNP